MSEKVTSGIGKGTPGPGRPKGVPNKINTELKELILKALEEVGGVAYLVDCAREQPNAFLSLLGKVLPMTVQGTGEGGNVVVEVVRFAAKEKGDE